MTDTVTRLMALADNYHHSFDSENIDGSIDRARQALEAELVRLFTPLSDEQIIDVLAGQSNRRDITLIRAVESCHGIGGES